MREDVVLAHLAFDAGFDFTVDISAAEPWEPAVLIRSAAAIRGVHGSVMEQQFHSYVDQYRGMPEVARPRPAASWLAAKAAGHRGYGAVKKDPALLWAAYRCQSDPNGVRGNTQLASIDLETSGPDGPGGFSPANGAIIEVGIVVVDQDGTEVERFESLVRPSEQVGRLYGTGAVHVHGITMRDVAGAPEWAAVLPEVERALTGRVTLAQNARFENAWLTHHMGEDRFNKERGLVDTLVLARNNFVLSDHKLETICTHLGVPYTNGHRALHDAEVTAAAFFAMRDAIEAEYIAAGHDIDQPA